MNDEGLIRKLDGARNRDVIIILLLLILFCCWAMKGQEVEITTTSTFVSDYMFRGVRLGGPSLQPSIETSLDNVTLGVWANQPLADRVPGFSDPELDLYASYAFEWTNGLSITPGVTAYVYPNADQSEGSYRSTFEPSLAVAYSRWGATATAKAYYDVVMMGPTFEFSAQYSVPLEKIHAELVFSATVGTYFWDESVKDADPRVENHGDYYQAGLSVPFAFGRWTITPGVAYAGSFRNYFDTAGEREHNDASGGRVVGSISASIKF